MSGSSDGPGLGLRAQTRRPETRASAALNLPGNIEGISSRVFTERLRVLEQKGFVFPHYEATIPPAVTYGLTRRLKDMERVLKDLDRLAEKWYQEDSPAGRTA